MTKQKVILMVEKHKHVVLFQAMYPLWLTDGYAF